MRTNTTAARAPRELTAEGTPAKRITDLQALRRAVASCLLWEDQFYMDGEAIADHIKRLTLAVAPHEAYSVAVEARESFKLRHAPLWVARWLASGTAQQKAGVAPLLERIIQRPDELAEFLAIYWRDGRTPIASSVKRGLAAAFQKFDAYSLAKYDRNDAIKLRDVLFMCHAKPKDEAQAADWRALVAGTLPTPDTWEVALSGLGKASPDEKLAEWTRLLVDRKLGALALLRNLRNMQAAGVELDAIRAGLESMNVERVLPFRFVAAARYAPRLEPELEQAMFRCSAGLPKLQGRTALVVDTSPSMWMAKVSAKSEMDRFDAAAALAILCREACESVDVYAFNHKAYTVPSRRGFALRDALAATKDSASCGGLAVMEANRNGYDRIIVLTDGQWHESDYSITRRSTERPAHVVAPKPLTEKAYLVNLAANRNAIGSERWVMLDGWSEAILDYIRVSEGAGLPAGNLD